MPSANAAASRCTSRIARCSDTSGTRAGITIGIVWSAGPIASTVSARRSATSVKTTRRRCEAHYANGPAPDWQQRFVTAYASAHPWEDWAETWAHYLHMTDTLETAAACGVSLTPAARRRTIPEKGAGARPAHRSSPFDRLIDSWYPLTYMLNSLNRGMGLADAYPFVLPAPAVQKLRVVHEIIAAGDPERT